MQSTVGRLTHPMGGPTRHVGRHMCIPDNSRGRYHVAVLNRAGKHPIETCESFVPSVLFQNRM